MNFEKSKSLEPNDIDKIAKFIKNKGWDLEENITIKSKIKYKSYLDNYRQIIELYILDNFKEDK